MSEAVITTLITGAISLIGIFWSGRQTREKVTQELDKKTALQQAEIEHIKESISEMKTDIKEHNHYAKLFAETMPVVEERQKVANHRIDDIERKLDKYETHLG